ncbi:MAG: glycosyltransferase [Muribaculaceae bacterium]|nr:glycosyltransferase [Muribaculaceae bacterium]
MKISVVTVCFNASDLIEQTIESVTGQTYPDMEYIVIDGASTDGTTDIIHRHADRISYWISEPDKGIYDAMNKGIEAATGEYVIFMNAGDRFANPHVLESAASHLGHHTVVSGLWNRCYSNGSVKKGIPKKISAFKTEMPICHQATFTNLRYHKQNLFDTSFRLSADYDFFYKAWRGGQTFLYIDLTIVDFLEAEGASTDNISTSVMEREKAWRGERNLLLRRMVLSYHICRIKTVKFIKKVTAGFAQTK